MTDTMSQESKVRAALAERLVRHVETLANTTMNLSMSEWNEISNHILDAANMIRRPAPDVPGAEEATMMRNLCSFINAVWAATDDAEGGTMDADGQEVVLIPLERFGDVCSSMDALDRMTADYTGWLGYRVKIYLSAQLDAARAKLAKRLEADMFWDYYDPEQPYYSVEELIQEREYEGEGIVQVQEAIRCPDAAYIYRITNDPETDDREIVLERLSDADHVHYRAAMAVASGAREMWGVMVDRLAAQLFKENPAPLPERMHTCQWKNLDWHYRKHHRSLAHDRLAATLTKD